MRSGYNYLCRLLLRNRLHLHFLFYRLWLLGILGSSLLLSRNVLLAILIFAEQLRRNPCFLSTRNALLRTGNASSSSTTSLSNDFTKISFVMRESLATTVFREKGGSLSLF